MFPPDLCKELECLHTQAPVHSLRFTKSAIAEAFPGSVGELFEQFDEQPVASGSIAQVYKARLSHRGALHTGMLAGKSVGLVTNHCCCDVACECAHTSRSGLDAIGRQQTTLQAV